MIRAALLALIPAALLAGSALAEPPAPPPPAAQKPVPAFGDDHPECAQWTDGCIVCVRGAEGPDCSLAGIACLPAEPACLTPKQ
jgi:hypothetical protein